MVDVTVITIIIDRYFTFFFFALHVCVCECLHACVYAVNNAACVNLCMCDCVCVCAGFFVFIVDLSVGTVTDVKNENNFDRSTERYNSVHEVT